MTPRATPVRDALALAALLAGLAAWALWERAHGRVPAVWVAARSGRC